MPRACRTGLVAGAGTRRVAGSNCPPPSAGPLKYAADVPVQLPGPQGRWRCRQCGNLTRFDVRRTVRSRDYVHVDLSGEQAVEERDVLDDVVEHVTCRWCSSVDAVDVVARPDS